MESELSNLVVPRKMLSSYDTIFCTIPCNPYLNHDGKCWGPCFKVCPSVCKILLVNEFSFPDPSTIPPPSSSRHVRYMIPKSKDVSHNHLIKTSLIITGCTLGAIILFAMLCTLFKIYYSRRMNSRVMSRARVFFGSQNSFFDGDQGAVVDHPIWYINTIGLEQSLIDSIAVFKYKKDEGLIEGTECSVCLNEFEEDESLRLLSNCKHAFHLPCIDTWLRTHKNCPLCRAPILCETSDDQAALSIPTSSGLSSSEESQMENSVNNSGSIRIREVGDGTSEVRSEDNNVIALPVADESVVRNSKMDSFLNVFRSHSRVLSDLVDTREAAETETETQPVRRSVSLDLASASAIHSSVALKKEENLDSQLEQLKNLESKRASKRTSSGNSSFRKLIKSSSNGISLHKGPVSMKRSFSLGLK
ncbi:hypothetical protein K2173_014818 [Erythroxylum novogranatense]|uniref:RING-type E3 ubiquitin transferase n=1 Tax=Erythroxylum novogranatense TaxID=1862640 RepID=A0AAV8TFU5_9ROSI|nr:hypothetical protein K2173_014818 [Erythroxylum novogranatense]